MFTTSLPNEQAMLDFGARLASCCPKTAVIFLYGNLGAGKTTLSRGFLRGLGYEGKVKSPTYTLVEPYDINEQSVFHFDLYRLHQPEELEFIGIQDYFVPNAICLVEWPEHGNGVLPPADLSCYIETTQADGRHIKLVSHSPSGKALIDKLTIMAGNDDN